MGSPRSASSRVRSCSATRSRTCRWASTSPSSTPEWEDRAARSRFATREGRLYVGPDNGLLLPAAERFGGVAEAHELANPEYALQRVSRTFHGRDLFSPAAAYLAQGVELGDLGPPVAAETLARLDLPQATIGEGTAQASVLYIDRYGNVQVNLDREDMDQIEIAPGTRVELDCKGEHYFAVAARTFADARPGDILLYEDSYRNIALAINGGNAAEMLAARPGDTISIRRASP